ncbi:MAG TPA: hypothetical protein VF848_08160 [Steroidobacteraceae bacterium]
MPPDPATIPPVTTPAASSAPGAIALPGVPATAVMDPQFIERHQIVERYIAGKLPLKGAQDFERFCKDHPELLEDLGLSARVNAGLRLLEAGGLAAPWEEKPRRIWEQWWPLPCALLLAVALGVVAMNLSSKANRAQHALTVAQQKLIEQPIDPVTTTRAITLIPSRTGPQSNPSAGVGGSGEMADFKIDLSWSAYSAFQVSIDRVDQGRIAVLHYMLRDSNGQLRFAINTSTLGPGIYQLAFEGMTLHGDAIPQAWATIRVSR